MDRDGFIITLISHYKGEIEEALVESEHIYRSAIDYEILEEKINHIISCAKVDGLEEAIVWEIVHSRIPTYINYMNFKKTSKKAA